MSTQTAETEGTPTQQPAAEPAAPEAQAEAKEPEQPAAEPKAEEKAPESRESILSEPKEPAAPVEYAFDEKADSVLVNALKEAGNEAGLSQEGAQKIYDSIAKHQQEALAKYEAEQKAAEQKQWDEWEAEIKALPDSDEQIQLARKAMNSMPDELKDMLKGAMGSWPPLVQWLAQMGKQIGEHQVHSGTGGSSTTTTPWAKMYPGMVKS